MSTPARPTVFWFLLIVAVGLNASLSTIFSPFDIPPWIPPDLQNVSLHV